MMPILNENFLLDDFHESGDRQETFEDLVRNIDKRTSCREYVLKNFTLFSLDAKQPDPSAIYGCVIPPQSPLVNREVITESGKMIAPSVRRGCIPVARLIKQGDFKPLLDEAMKTSRLMLYNRELSGDEKLAVFMSRLSIKTLAQRLALKSKPLEKSTLPRDLHLASLMNQDMRVTIVSKQFNHVSKVFAVLGSEFVNTSLFIICELYSLVQEEAPFGRMDCVSWDVTHKRAKITFCFPDLVDRVQKKYNLKEPITPYVEYISSDTGENSLQVRSFWVTKSGDFIPGNRYRRRHRGHFESTDKMKQKIDEAVFQKMEEVPALFYKLQPIRISPDGYTPDSTHWVDRNYNYVFRALKYVVKEIHVSEVVGKKRQMRLNKLLEYGLIKGEAVYTAYDILMEICGIPALLRDRVNDPGLFKQEKKELSPISGEPERKLKEKCIAKALALDYEEVRKYAMREGSH